MDKEADSLFRGAKALCLELSNEQVNKFLLYKNILLEWNKKINLTAITEPEEIMIKHFLDSIALNNYLKLKPEDKVIDVGTGAGFPGIPLKIYEPKLQLLLLDSIKKRTVFLEEIKEELFLDDVMIIHGRAEELGSNALFRENYDFAVSRAVAKLSILAELCLPFVRKGGKFIAYKGPNIKEELPAAQKAIKELGGEVREIISINLPVIESIRNLVVIEKKSSTPLKYPRKPGTPEKRPIE